jgi:hypothetical protein
MLEALALWISSEGGKPSVGCGLLDPLGRLSIFQGWWDFVRP